MVGNASLKLLNCIRKVFGMAYQLSKSGHRAVVFSRITLNLCRVWQTSYLNLGTEP
uniref:Uncharacterized protein n=1 Tax=Aegilops tauschii subsp. strangulata TaxID=200361 RepID=A0A452ZH60_AEGTS